MGGYNAKKRNAYESRYCGFCGDSEHTIRKVNTRKDCFGNCKTYYNQELSVSFWMNVFQSKKNFSFYSKS